MPKPVKSLNILSATSRVVSFLKVMKKPIIYKFFKDFTDHRKKTNRKVVFSNRHLPTMLNTGTTDDTFQKSRKQEILQTQIEEFTKYL